MKEEHKEIIEKFERKDPSIAERIAWGKTLFELDNNDLLKLWMGASFDHPLRRDDELNKLLKERINATGGFHLVS